jgi:5-methylcytosine-specific restriction endonuclease McrA
MKCEVCNNEFKPKNTLHKFCSTACKKKIQSINNSAKRSIKRNDAFAKVDKNRKCLVCGTEFEISITNRTKKYCSDDCSNKAERLFGSKKNADLDYKNKIRFSGKKYEILIRDNYECQICGNKSQLVIHHKDHSGKEDEPNNDSDNLVTLCRKCHINIHRLNL